MRVLNVFVIASSLLAATLLGGCARSSITTEIKTGGSWTRTVALTGQEKKRAEWTWVPLWRMSSRCPSGGEWKSREQKKDSDRTLTFERSLAAGSSLEGDLTIKGGEADKPMMHQSGHGEERGAGVRVPRNAALERSAAQEHQGESEARRLAALKAAAFAKAAGDGRKRACHGREGGAPGGADAVRAERSPARAGLAASRSWPRGAPASASGHDDDEELEDQFGANG